MQQSPPFLRLVLPWRHSTLLMGPATCLNHSTSFFLINLKEINSGLMVPSYHLLKLHQHTILLLIINLPISVHLIDNQKSEHLGSMVPSNHPSTQYQNAGHLLNLHSSSLNTSACCFNKYFSNIGNMSPISHHPDSHSPHPTQRIYPLQSTPTFPIQQSPHVVLGYSSSFSLILFLSVPHHSWNSKSYSNSQLPDDKRM